MAHGGKNTPCLQVKNCKNFICLQKLAIKISWKNVHRILTGILLVIYVFGTTLLLIYPLLVHQYYESLPAVMWFPTQLDKENYWFYYFYEMVMVYISGYDAVICGVTFGGIILEVYIQFDILKKRFLKVPEFPADFENQMSDNLSSRSEEKRIAGYIEHHKKIYRYL